MRVICDYSNKTAIFGGTTLKTDLLYENNKF